MHSLRPMPSHPASRHPARRTCVYGQGSRKLQMTCWIIFGVFVVISLMLSAFKNKWVKQDSDQAVK